MSGFCSWHYTNVCEHATSMVTDDIFLCLVFFSNARIIIKHETNITECTVGGGAYMDSWDMETQMRDWFPHW